MAISLFLMLSKEIDLTNNYQSVSYASINTKNIATVKIANKKGYADGNTLTEVNNSINIKQTTEVKQPEPINNQVEPIWYLPVENGIITQYPSATHPALDITSVRGVYETIYPVAPGTITSIYTDGAGGKIVTIHHLINGKNYTSMYVHFSSYAPDIYVGKEVGVNDALGQMGATGWATGVHLHLAIVDCSLYDSTDYNCQDLGRFFNYATTRYYQGYYGLQSLRDVPYRWYSR